jgi:hypothetical protein
MKIGTNEWIPWEQYLIWLGEVSVDYSYTKEMIYANLNYFKEGWLHHTSPYKMLEMFDFKLD